MCESIYWKYENSRLVHRSGSFSLSHHCHHIQSISCRQQERDGMVMVWCFFWSEFYLTQTLIIALGYIEVLGVLRRFACIYKHLHVNILLTMLIAQYVWIRVVCVCMVESMKIQDPFFSTFPHCWAIVKKYTDRLENSNAVTFLSMRYGGKRKCSFCALKTVHFYMLIVSFLLASLVISISLFPSEPDSINFNSLWSSSIVSPNTFAAWRVIYSIAVVAAAAVFVTPSIAVL